MTVDRRKIAEDALVQARAYLAKHRRSTRAKRNVEQIEAYLADPERSPLESATRPKDSA